MSLFLCNEEMNDKEFSVPTEIGFTKNDYVHKKSFHEEGILCCKDSLFLFGNFRPGL